MGHPAEFLHEHFLGRTRSDHVVLRRSCHAHMAQMCSDGTDRVDFGRMSNTVTDLDSSLR